MTTRSLRSFLALAALALAGCSANEIEPVYLIEPEDYCVVMPFKDPDFASRWDSPRSHDMGQLTTAALTERAEFKVRPYEDVISLFQADDVKKLGPREVAALTRADYVLVCDVEKFDLENDVINLGRGKARAKVRLFKVERRTPEEEAKEAEKAREREEVAKRVNIPVSSTDAGGRYVREDIIEAVFPSDYHNDYGRLDLKAAEIQTGLMGVISRKVAKLYYTHDEEKIEVE
jgi:hypothetical protein